MNATTPQNGIFWAVNEIDVRDGWIQLSPYGEFPNEVGLQIFDRAAAEEMVREFSSLATKAANRFRGAPLYVGHPDAEGGEVDPRYGKAALGWIKELQAREDGLYAKPKWSTAGNEVIDQGYFQFVSPYWGMRPLAGRKNAFTPVALFSVGLTNNPNIPGLPVGRNEQTNQHMTKESKIKLIKALALAEDATDEQIITALNEVRQKKDDAESKLATATNDKTRLEGELKTANATSASNEEKFKSERKARVDQILTGAVNEGRITEAQRAEWAGKLTTDFDGESKKLGELKKALNTEPRSKALGSRKNEVTVPADRIAAINSAVSKHMKENGTTHGVAWVAVKAQQPKLFEEETAAV